MAENNSKKQPSGRPKPNVMKSGVSKSEYGKGGHVKKKKSV